MTLRTVKRLAVLGVLVLAGRAEAGGGNAGTTAANFLTQGAGGAPLGMGGAALALGGDLAAAAWNPAALGGIGSAQLALSHAGLPDESRQEWVALGGTVRGPAWNWGLSGLFVNQGSIEGRDASNQPTGALDASSVALGGTLTRNFGSGAAGVTARWVGDHLGPVTGSGFTFDAGLQLRRAGFGLGAAAQNVGGQMAYGSTRYPFPTNYGAGLSFEDSRGIRAALDMNFPYAYYQDVRLGLEYRWKETLALRTGYRRELGSDPASEALTGPSFGLGAGAHGLWLDYAWLPSNLGASEHRIGLTFVPERARMGQ